MNNIGKAVRDELHRKSRIMSGRPGTVLESEDGTKKMLVHFGSKHSVECVAIPAGERLTFCLSTMVGSVLLEPDYRAPGGASACSAVIAAATTTSSTVQPRDRSLAGRASPCTIGPIAWAPANRSTSL